MKFNKMMTKILSVLIMASMVGTSVQMPTLAQISDAGRAIVDNVKENTATDADGSTESDDTAAAGDEDNKNEEGAEAANENAEAASDNGAQNNSQGEANTSSSSAARNNSSSSSSYNNSAETSQVLEPYSTENDSDQLWFDQSFSLFEYFGAKKTFTATAANGDGNDIVWEVGDPKYVSLSEPRVDGDKSTVDITWDGETVDSIERTPFYAMLKSNPYERITGTIYLSNGTAPQEGMEEEIEAGSKTEFESEEVRKFVEEMYASGLTQENSIYDLSSFGDTASSTPDYSTMTDEEILALFDEKQADENKADTESGTLDKNVLKQFEEKKEISADSDKSEKVDTDKSENEAENDTIYNKEETQSKVSQNETKANETTVETKAETAASEKVDTDTDVTAADKASETKETATEETVTTKTIQKEVTEEVTSTKKTALTTTKTTTTEIVSEEPIVETTTKTVYEEVPSEKEMRVQTLVEAAYDEETGETTYETVEETITVPTTETVAKEETVEEVVGTNYTVR